jgi:hypothetical protein
MIVASPAVPTEAQGSAAKSFLVLPCYKDWESATYRSVFRRVEQTWGREGGLGKVGISFKLSSKHVVHVLMNMNRHPGDESWSDLTECAQLQVGRQE